MTEYMPAVSKSIICNHNQRVQDCSECNSLLPGSFWSRMTWQRFQPEPNTYHACTLTNCLAKAYFERTSLVNQPVGSAWAKLRRTLLHCMVRSLGWSELRVKIVFKLGDEAVTIIGYVDAFDPDTATVYDLKTTRFARWQAEKGHLPRENHTAQVQCYATLLGQYGIVVNRLVLVYVDDKEIIPEEVPLGYRKEWMTQRATVLHQSMKDSVLPTPEPGPMCPLLPVPRQVSWSDGYDYSERAHTMIEDTLREEGFTIFKNGSLRRLSPTHYVVNPSRVTVGI
jgi:CRISPR/Cas system-associated exonuclease Cas4 (RecB family)